MSYDEEIREDIYEACERDRERTALVLDTIRSLTLKTEDGRFVKVEPVWYDRWDHAFYPEGVITNEPPDFYRIVEEDQP